MSKIASLLEQRLSLAGKTAVVTGSASGIGRTTAILLCALGARTYFLDRDSAGIGQAVAETAGLSGVASPLPTDLSDLAQIEASFANVISASGRIDILVNSAAMNIAGPSVDLDMEAWQKVIDVNLTGLFLCCRLAARSMIASGGGAIVNVASVGGLRAGATGRTHPNPSYRASKGGVVNLTRALAIEWADKGIRVNAVAPGYVRTPMTARVTTDPARLATVEQLIPMGRFAEPDEIAWVIAFLAGGGASMMTGQTVVVDGGLLS